MAGGQRGHAVLTTVVARAAANVGHGGRESRGRGESRPARSPLAKGKGPSGASESPPRGYVRGSIRPSEFPRRAHVVCRQPNTRFVCFILRCRTGGLQGVPWGCAVSPAGGALGISCRGCYWHPCRGCPGGAGVFLYTAPPCIPCNCTQPARRAFYALCTLPCVTECPDNTHVTRAR